MDQEPACTGCCALYRSDKFDSETTGQHVLDTPASPKEGMARCRIRRHHLGRATVTAATIRPPGRARPTQQCFTIDRRALATARSNSVGFDPTLARRAPSTIGIP